MSELTDFQESCETGLTIRLAEIGKVIVGRKLLGNDETYIQASIGDSTVVFYIYEDEAQYHVSGVLKGLYEIPDYRSLSELENAFISGVIDEASAI